MEIQAGPGTAQRARELLKVRIKEFIQNRELSKVTVELLAEGVRKLETKKKADSTRQYQSWVRKNFHFEIISANPAEVMKNLSLKDVANLRIKAPPAVRAEINASIDGPRRQEIDARIMKAEVVGSERYLKNVRRGRSSE